MKTTMLVAAMIAISSIAMSSDDSSLGLKPPAGSVVLFDGSNTDAWSLNSGRPFPWAITVDRVLQSQPGRGSISTKESFGDSRIHVEFNLANMPDRKSQGRCNS